LALLSGVGITGYVLHVSPSSNQAFEIWKYFAGIITGIIGFLFGKGSKP
jgi:tellurite resistance protein TehA-like permease